MIWPLTPAIAAYLVVAVLVWLFGGSLVAASPAGRRGLPIVALLWPLSLWVLILIGLVRAFDAAVERALEETFGPDDENAP